jgi:NAD(P)H-flavin reductase/hemoglobin-like flavoprotein
MIDAAALKGSWEHVASHGDQVPLFFYSTLFLTEPRTRDLFPVSMAGQRGRFVTALGRIVSSVDHLDELQTYLQQLGRDHRKFSVVREHYPVVGEALLATLEHFLGTYWTSDLARDWNAAYGLVAKIMIEAAAEAETTSPAWWEAEVVRHEQPSLDLSLITIRPNYRFDYLPGQSMAVEVPARPRLWRYYSPANAPRPDNTIDLHVRQVDGGLVSTALVQLTQPGDVLRLGAPVGDRLTLDPGSRRDILLLAGGTGLAPLKAVAEQLAAEGGSRRTHLFWGVRRSWELYDLPALRELASRGRWLRVVPCVSHGRFYEEDGEQGIAVNVALKYGSWAEHDIYICGSPQMVKGSIAALNDAGVPLDRIQHEGFGNEEALI